MRKNLDTAGYSKYFIWRSRDGNCRACSDGETALTNTKNKNTSNIYQIGECATTEEALAMKNVQEGYVRT